MSRPRPGISFSLLGPLRVWGDDGNEVALGGPKPSAMLAALLLEANRIVSVDRLIDSLWGDDAAAGAPATVQVYVHNLRRALVPVTRAEIVTQRPGYTLETDPDSVDQMRFATYARAASDAAEGGHLRQALDQVDAALALWRGRALDDLVDLDWAWRASSRFEDQRLDAIELRNELRLALGLHRELIPSLEAQVVENPLRERLWTQLMLALYRDGRQRDALHAFERIRAILVEELGLDPGPELRDLESAILRHDPALQIPASRPPVGTTWPGPPDPLSALVGRRAERSALDESLRDASWVTVVGPPGIGKTRLVIELARQPSDRRHACAYLDLSTIEHGDEAERAIDDLLSHLTADSQDLSTTLLVLDGCEHVVHRLAQVMGRWRMDARGLRVVATSQTPLHLPGEVIFPLGPLAGPEVGAVALATLESTEAIRLFVARAGAARPSFSLDTANAAAVAHVVAMLDGIPLAIELAAAQMRARSVVELARDLDENFAELPGASDGSGSQQTLREAVSWSLALLDEQSRDAFLALSTLVGAFTMDDALAVLGAPREDGIRGVVLLVDRSLVSVAHDPDGLVRYRILEPIRRVATLDLEEGRSAADVRARHARHFIELAATSGPLDPSWVKHVGRIAANLGAALRFSISIGATHDATRAAIILASYYRRAGSLDRAQAALAAVTPMVDALEAPDAMDLLLAISSLAVERQDCATALRLVADVVVRADAVEDAPRRAHALVVEAAARREVGDHDLAQSCLMSALELFETADDISGAAVALGQLGMLERARGDNELAMGLLRQGIARMSSVRGATSGWSLAEIAVHQRGRSLLLSEMGSVATSSGELDRAGQYFTESLLVSAGADHRRGIAATLEALAVLAAQRRMPKTAATLLGAIEILLELDDATFRTVESERLEAALVAEIGLASVQMARRRGRSLSLDQSVRLGLEVAGQSGRASSPELELVR